MDEKEEALAMVITISRDIDMIVNLTDKYGTELTLAQLFDKAVSEKRKYWNKLTN